MAGDTGPETPADLRREQMLVAAAELMPQHGFAATRIADVARRAGVSPALVIYYFGTKDKLLIEALRHSEQAFDDQAKISLADTSSLEERLRIVVDLSCRPTEEQASAWSLWLELWAQATRRPEVAAYRVSIEDDWRAVLDGIVQDGVDSGEVSATEVSDFAVTFSALLDGLLIQVVLNDPAMSGERAAAIAMRFAREALGMDETSGPDPAPDAIPGVRRRSSTVDPPPDPPARFLGNRPTGGQTVEETSSP